MSDLSSLSDADLAAAYQKFNGAAPTPADFTGTRITVGGPPPSGMSDQDLMAAYKAHQPDGAPIDFAKSLGIGAVKGVIGLAGLPGAMRGVAEHGVDALSEWIISKATSPEDQAKARAVLEQMKALRPAPVHATPEDIQKGVEGFTGPFRKPEGAAGEYGQAIGEFLPGAMAGPGGVVGNAIRYGVAPAITSETVGRIPGIKGSPVEQPARIATAIATGGIAGLTGRPSTAAQTIRNQLPPGVTPQMVDQAERLIADAGQRGITLSWPEALSQVAGRPVLSELARHIEASPATTARAAEFYGQRPQQVETAARNQFDAIAPTNNAPSMIGPHVGEAASDILGRVNAAINQATRPSYDAARQSLVPPAVHGAMRQDPLFVEALDAVRNDPARNSFIRGLSDRSTVVYDAVKQELAERSRNALSPANPNASKTVSAATGSLGGDVKNIAVAADRNAMGLTPGQGVGNLEHALAEQARLRQQYLEPLQRGPLGRAANKDQTTQKAIEAVFGSESQVPGSATEIETAVRALAAHNPRAAADLVRAHTEMTFNSATKDLQGGANQAGGAKFRVQLVGDPQQRANFEAAVRALPHGAARLDGFNRFLDIMEAIGTRQNVGSKTAYNAEFLKGASSSGVAGEIVKGAANPFSRLAQGLVDKYERWKLGNNLNELADILFDPAAVGQLRAIARMPTNSTQAQALALRIAAQTRSAVATTSEQRQQPRQ